MNRRLRIVGYLLGPVLILLVGVKAAGLVGRSWGVGGGIDGEEPPLDQLYEAPRYASSPIVPVLASFPRRADALYFVALNRWLVFLGPKRVVRTNIDGGDEQDLLDFKNGLPDWCRQPAALSRDGDRHVWLTDFRGHLILLNVASHDENPVRVVAIEAGLTRMARFGTRVVSAPMVGKELLRTYDLGDDSDAPADHAVQKTNLAKTARRRGGAGGGPYDGLVWQLGVFLNYPAMAASNARDRIALAFHFDSRINIHRSDGRLERSVAGPEGVKLDFRIKHRADNPYHFIRSPQTTQAYTDITVDRDVVLALFSGRSLRQYGVGHTSGDQLQAFTWSGEYVGSWRLAVPVDLISLAPGSDVLFGLRYAQGGRVVSFDISEIRAAARNATLD